MPRKPRMYLQTNFFHIVNQGVNKEYIFDSELNKKQYLKLLFQNKDKHNINIISFAIMDNHFHLLVYIKNIKELSEYMKSVNESYAMFYNKLKNRVGPVFRERFKSQPIVNEKYLYQCVLYIHENPVKAGITSKIDKYAFASTTSYSLEKISKILNKNVNTINIEVSEKDFLDIKYEKSESELENIISKIILDTKLKLNINEIDKKDGYVIKYIINRIREETGASMERIANSLKISKSTVHKYIKLKKESD